MQTSIVERLKEKYLKAANNTAAVTRETQLREEIEPLEIRLGEIGREHRQLAEQTALEAPHFQLGEAKTELAAPFVNAAHFPPKKLDEAAALRAVLQLCFADQRRAVLNARERELETERKEVEAKLKPLRAELVTVQKELGG